MCDRCTSRDSCDYIAARGGEPGDPRLVAEYDRLERRRIRDLIARKSWLVVAAPDPWPGVAYTVGLWSRRRPELCVFGLPPNVGHGMLNTIGKAIGNGMRVRDGDEIDGAQFGVPDCPLRVFDLPNAHEVLIRTQVYYRRRPGQPVPALQLVYPDADGNWPWEPGYRLPRGMQPMPGTYVA